MLNKSLLLLIALFCAITTSSQTVDKVPKSEDDERLNEKAVAFLRETQADVNNMRTLENRISFTSELASLMWFHDEREARAMFNGVSGDFRQLIVQYDGQMNALGPKPEDGSETAGFFIFDPSERSNIERKFRTAMAVRQQIAMGMAEHDPELAFTFYYDSLNAISNLELRKRSEENDQYFEFQLINQIADKAPDKAVKFANKSLAKGFSYQHIELLRKIYTKDQEKAIDLAGDILSRLKNEKLNSDEMWAVSSLISFGEQIMRESQTDGKKKAVYTQTDLRDITEILAQSVLDRPADSGPVSPDYMHQIEKYAPGRVPQIRAKFKQSNGMGDRYGYGNGGYSNVATNVAVARGMDTATNSMASNSANANMSPAQQARLDREKNEKQIMNDAMKVGNKDLPKEQRDDIIAQARRIMMTTPGRDKKVAGLSLLAAQVANAGDKELANQIMKDAESLVNPQPKNYQDFLLTWMLVTGYANANPDKAFPLLQDTIARANDTLAAFVKVAEFIDANEEMIQDGEIQVGAFGGSMVRGLTGELGMADSTIRVLAKADFDKTKDLTNRFERPEIRILAKMMVLRSVLGDKADTKTDSDAATLLADGQ